MAGEKPGTGAGRDRTRSATRPIADASVARLVERLRETRPTLIVLAGPILGARIALTQRSTILGRSGDCDVTVPDDGVSQRHAEVRCHDDGRIELIDLGSTNGTLVDGEQIKQRFLDEGDRIVIGHTPMRFTVYSAGEDDLLADLERRAVHDPVTGIANRRYLEARLSQEIRFASRRGTTVSLLLIDVDNFRKVVDAWGHPVGDRLLHELAAYVAGCVRSEDVAARYGGDVLAVLLRDVGSDGAEALARRLLEGIAGFPFAHEGNRIPVSVSIGAATAAGRKGLRSADIADEADSQLERAKREGRNRACHAKI